MYPEGGGEEMPAEAGGGFRNSVSYHLEGLIPLILIIIIGVVAGSQQGLGLWEIPFLGDNQPMRMLVIGTPNANVEAILNDDAKFIRTVTLPADRLTVNPKEQLSQYDVLLLDQSFQSEKFLPRQAGEAIQDWVKKGGKVIIVMNSGILRRGATDIVGWKAGLGDIVPVECQRLQTGQPACLEPVLVKAAEITREDFDHPIVEGFEVAPALPTDPPLTLTTFDVVNTGNELAFIRDIETGKFYPAISEKKSLLGKVIYYNYDPSLTRGLFEATLEYLR